MNRIETINDRINKIEASERVTKDELRLVSREVLEQVIEDNDVRHANKLINVLTPMNRKTAVIFFKHFLPFVVLTHETGEFLGFGEMKKKHKEGKYALIREFLNDPLNNIWTWADRNIEVEKKPFEVSKVTKVIKKALTEDIKDTDIIRAVIDAGLSVDAIMEVLKAQAEQEEAAEEDKAVM